MSLLQFFTSFLGFSDQTTDRDNFKVYLKRNFLNNDNYRD